MACGHTFAACFKVTHRSQALRNGRQRISTGRLVAQLAAQFGPLRRAKLARGLPFGRDRHSVLAEHKGLAQCRTALVLVLFDPWWRLRKSCAALRVDTHAIGRSSPTPKGQSSKHNGEQKLTHSGLTQRDQSGLTLLKLRSQDGLAYL